MSIRITNVEYKAATSSDTNNFLKSVTGEYGLLSIDFTAMPYIQPDRGISLTIIKPNLIRIDNGYNWEDYGFTEGDTLALKSILSIGGAPFNYDYRFLIDYIDDDVISVSNIEFYQVGTAQWISVDSLYHTYDSDIPLPGSFAYNDVQYTVSDVLVYLYSTQNANVFESIEINHAKIANEDRGGQDVRSVLDDTEPLFVFEPITQMLTPRNGESRSYKSGSGVVQTSMQRVANEVTNIGNYQLSLNKYQLDILFNVALFGETFDLNNDQNPDYFFDKETVTDGLSIRCVRFIDDDTSALQITPPLRKGRVGYLDEDFKGRESTVVAQDIDYLDQNGQADFSLAYNAQSCIEFTIKNIPNLGANTKFNFGAAVIPNAYTNNKKTALQNYQLVTGKNGYEAYTSGMLRATNFDSYSIGDIDNNLYEGKGSLNINHISVSQLTPTSVRCKVRFEPSDNVTIDTTDYFCVYAIVNGSYSVKVDYQKFKEYENIIGALELQSKFYPSYLDLDADNGISNIDVMTVQDLVSKGVFKVPKTETVRSISFRVEAKLGDLEYTLQNEEIEIPEEQPADQVNVSRTSNISGLAEDRDVIRLVYTDQIVGSNNYNGFAYRYPFRSRWEYWIERLDTPDDWYNSALPNEGRNNDWVDYMNVAGTQIMFSIYVETDRGFYVNRQDVSPADYNSSPDVDTLIQVYRSSDNALLWQSTNADGFDEGYVLQDTDMYIIATHTNNSGLWDANSAGDITIERLEQSGQYEIRATFSEITQPDTEPLGQITKTFNSNDMELRCDLAGAFIDPQFNYVIKSRSFNYYDDATGIGVLSNYNPYSSEFTPEFTVGSISLSFQ